eukprot:3385218-Pleurochrysis_carterae.AAC.5
MSPSDACGRLPFKSPSKVLAQKAANDSKEIGADLAISATSRTDSRPQVPPTRVQPSRYNTLSLREPLTRATTPALACESYSLGRQATHGASALPCGGRAHFKFAFGARRSVRPPPTLRRWQRMRSTQPHTLRVRSSKWVPMRVAAVRHNEPNATRTHTVTLGFKRPPTEGSWPPRRLAPSPLCS